MGWLRSSHSLAPRSASSVLPYARAKGRISSLVEYLHRAHGNARLGASPQARRLDPPRHHFPQDDGGDVRGFLALDCLGT